MRHLIDHLDETALVDAAEGMQSKQAAAHLAGCERCRTQVAELRAAIQLAGDAPVPEPSPLFWDHLSARVREAVADAAGERSSEAAGWSAWIWSSQGLATAAAVVVLALGVGIGLYSPSGTSSVEAPQTASVTPVATDLGDLTPPSLDNDPSLSFIADLAGDLDWEDAVEAGLTSGAGAVDRVVFDMSDDERRELQRVLQEAMVRPGA